MTLSLPQPGQSSAPCPPFGEAAPLARLYELFASLPDARVSGRVLHRLPEVLLVALCAMHSDCKDYTDMGIFAQSQLEWLRRFTPLVHGAPSPDVFRNVFMSLRPEALLEVMQQWVGELGGQHIAIDGKVSRWAKDPGTGKSSLHLLRAWVGQANLSVGYAACADKSSELEALPRLLASLQFKGAVVTIDAIAGHPRWPPSCTRRGPITCWRPRPMKSTPLKPSKRGLRQGVRRNPAPHGRRSPPRKPAPGR